MDDATLPCKDLEHIFSRIKQKKEDYGRYNFSRGQNDLLRTFFDLAQEFDSLEDFYRISVGVLYEFMQLESALFLEDEKEKKILLVCDSRKGVIDPSEVEPPKSIYLNEEPYTLNDTYIVPIHRKPIQNQEHPQQAKSKLMGLLQVSPLSKLTGADRFFLGKYSNRIGYNLHNRRISTHNINHLRFINNLVMDIEHNVITPNMYFKHLFKQLKRTITELGELERYIQNMKSAQKNIVEKCDIVSENISIVHAKLLKNHRQLAEYHANTSLFLESLFRRDHFLQGHLVLRPRLCSLEEEVILPQLEYYEKRFADRGITVKKPADMLGEMIMLNVDVGLLAQVYANLFSNAVKYTQPVYGKQGGARKLMAYGREIIRNYFSIGHDAIKCNVFTTGKHLSAKDANAAFANGFRSEDTKDLPGTGHGLSFIKLVIEMHGGLVGYEPTEQGNNFYFILPIPEQKPALKSTG